MFRRTTKLYALICVIYILPSTLCLLPVLLYQAMGRTPLSEVSPKKTLEGAACGLSSSIAVSVVLARVFQWPMSIPR